MKTKQKDGTIAKVLNEWMSEDKNIGSVCAFRTSDFWNLKDVLENKPTDFIIFNNGGGRVFFIWTKKECKSVKLFLNHLRKTALWSIYMYKVDNIEYILNNLP